MPLALFALAISAFGIGTCEFIVSGLLPEMADDLRVGLPAAGLLVTGYAFGIVVGAPLLTLLGTRLPRKTMLLALMVLFIIGNLLSALAPVYATLMVGRILAAFAHGAYFGIGAVVAADLVEPHRRARAIALMFTGLSLANVLGVPGGTAIGQAFGWRATFWVVVAIGIAGLIGVAVLVPARGRPDDGGLGRQLTVFRRGTVWLALATTVLGFAPVFTVITFIAPLMTDVTGFAPRAVPVVMVVIGAGLVLGNLLGGRYADRSVPGAIYGSVTALSVLSVVIALAATSKPAFVVAVTLFGMAAFATIPPLQTRVLDSAGQAPALASAANIGAFNLANALGSLLAGLAVDTGHGYTSPAWIAAGLGLAGLATAWWSNLWTRRHTASPLSHEAQPTTGHADDGLQSPTR